MTKIKNLSIGDYFTIFGLLIPNGIIHFFSTITECMRGFDYFILAFVSLGFVVLWIRISEIKRVYLSKDYDNEKWSKEEQELNIRKQIDDNKKALDLQIITLGKDLDTQITTLENQADIEEYFEKERNIYHKMLWNGTTFLKELKKELDKL